MCYFKVYKIFMTSPIQGHVEEAHHGMKVVEAPQLATQCGKVTQQGIQNLMMVIMMEVASHQVTPTPMQIFPCGQRNFLVLWAKPLNWVWPFNLMNLCLEHSGLLCQEIMELFSSPSLTSPLPVTGPPPFFRPESNLITEALILVTQTS